MSAEERKQVAEDKKKNAEFHVLDETPFWSNGTPGFTSKMRTRLFLYDEKKAELTPVQRSVISGGSQRRRRSENLLFRLCVHAAHQAAEGRLVLRSEYR